MTYRASEIASPLAQTLTRRCLDTEGKAGPAGAPSGESA